MQEDVYWMRDGQTDRRTDRQRPFSRLASFILINASLENGLCLSVRLSVRHASSTHLPAAKKIILSYSNFLFILIFVSFIFLIPWYPHIKQTIHIKRGGEGDERRGGRGEEGEGRSE